LPPVILETARRSTPVLEKAVSIVVSVAARPLERPYRRLAMSPERIGVPRPMPVLRQRHHEHRRRRLRAVVRTLWNHVELRERPAPFLMNHLAGLSIVPGGIIARLRLGYTLQRAPEHLRTDERPLPGSRQRVAAKQPRIGRHTRVWHPAVVRHVHFPGAER